MADSRPDPYGLIFGASLSTFGRNSGAPYFDQNRNFYKFDLQFNNPDNTTVGFVRMERYDNGVPTLIYSKTSVANLPSVGTWHKITVRRQNGTLTAYVNGILVASTYDTNFSGAREFGVFFQSKSLNNTVTPLQTMAMRGA